MKQEFRASLFSIFCIVVLMFSTTQAFGGFEPNLVGEQQRELNKENHSIDKDKKISKINQKARQMKRKIHWPLAKKKKLMETVPY